MLDRDHCELRSGLTIRTVSFLDLRMYHWTPSTDVMMADLVLEGVSVEVLSKDFRPLLVVATNQGLFL